MSRWFTAVAFLVLASASAVGQTPAALEREKAELLRLHRDAREAHFRTDVELLLRDEAEGFVTVSRGKVHRPRREETRRQFEEYFRGAKYYEWDDLEEPIIRVSRDATMAWMITRIRVRRVRRDASGGEREERFVYAGIMTYEKRGGRWTRVANVSTFEPPN